MGVRQVLRGGRHWVGLLGGVLLVGVAGCQRVSPEAPTLSSRIYSVPLEGVSLTSGLTSHTVQVEGRGRRFALWVPPGGATRGHPLFLYLHGAVTKPTFRRVECQFTTPFAGLAPIVIAPVAPGGRGGRWWKEEEASFALGLLRSALESWPVDPKRVVLMGYSNGGIGAWALARAYPQFFSAAIPMAFNHTVVGKTPLPVFAIQGERDELFGSQGIMDGVKQLQAEGQDVRLAVRPHGSHFKPCSYEAELKQASAWLEQHVWASREPGDPSF